MSDHASLTTAADADREMNRWLGPLFIAMIFAFTSIAVVNTLTMIALRRGRELALLRLVGATPRALTGSLHPYVPAAPLAAILGVSALLALLAQRSHRTCSSSGYCPRRSRGLRSCDE